MWLIHLIIFFSIAGVAARETAQALRTLAQAARGVAASTKEPQAAAAMLDSAQYVMEGSAMLIHEAHQALVQPGDAESQQRLAQVAQVPATYSQMQYQCPPVITLFFSVLFPYMPLICKHFWFFITITPSKRYYFLPAESFVA